MWRMVLLMLLAIPLAVAAVGLLVSKGRFNWLEALVQAAVGVALMGGGYMAARYAKTVDTEVWNGKLVKTAGTQRCCHSYSCNCSTTCSTDMEGHLSCSEDCETCYEHEGDLYWSASTTNGESIFHDGCNPPGTDPPAAWLAMEDGEPTAVERKYINYIKGAPGRFFRRPWLLDRYKGRLPPYPRVHGLYKADRFIMSSIGEAMPDLAGLNRELSRINGDLGKARQVNIIVVVTAEDSSYAEALSEAWLGGKKNDLIVVVGVHGFPRIGWARVVSWTDARGIKGTIEDRVVGLGDFDGRRLLSVVEHEVSTKFQRRPMRDFRYLIKEIEPPTWALWILVALGLLVSGGLQAWFWVRDPFGRDRTTRRA